MKLLVNTQEIEREQWLDWRRKGIGGSDVAAIVGLNKYKSALSVFLEKTGQKTDEVDNIHTEVS